MPKIILPAPLRAVFSQKYFLKTGQDVYVDFQTGETLNTAGREGEKNLRAVKAGVVIEYVPPTTRKFLVRGSKMSMNYVYLDKESRKYYMSSTLDTSYLSTVIRLEHKDSNAFVVYGERCVLFFYGDNVSDYVPLKHSYYSKQGREEVRAHAEGIFQGVPYREIPLDDAVKLVRPSRNKLYFALLLLFLVFAFYAFNSMDDSAEEGFKIPTFNPSKEEIEEKFPRVKIPKSLEGIYTTDMALDRFTSMKPDPLSMVLEYDFSKNPTAKYGYFYPAVGTTKEGDLYTKVKTPSVIPVESLIASDTGAVPDPRVVLGLKNRISCMLFYRKLDVLENDKDRTVYNLSGDIPVSQIANLMLGSRGCPVQIEGSINYNGSVFRRSVDLRITVYNIDSIWSRYHRLVEKRLKKISEWKQEEQSKLIEQAKRLMNGD